MITLTQLEYIVALDDVRHFAAAADKCFVTQPTLSMQVKKLEEDLGVIIFDRKRQPLEPTEIGKKIISQARAALASSNRIKEIIREEQRVVSGTLRIGIIPTLAPYLLPPLMKQMAQEYPDLEIGVEEVESEELVRRLKSERLTGFLRRNADLCPPRPRTFAPKRNRCQRVETCRFVAFGRRALFPEPSGQPVQHNAGGRRAVAFPF